MLVTLIHKKGRKTQLGVFSPWKLFSSVIGRYRRGRRSSPWCDAAFVCPRGIDLLRFASREMEKGRKEAAFWTILTQHSLIYLLHFLCKRWGIEGREGRRRGKEQLSEKPLPPSILCSSLAVHHPHVIKCLFVQNVRPSVPSGRARPSVRASLLPSILTTAKQ